MADMIKPLDDGTCAWHDRTQPRIAGGRVSEGHSAADDDDDLASEKGHLLTKRALFSTIIGGGGGAACPPLRPCVDYR